MNKLARYIIIVAVTSAALFVIWYFQNIVGYVLAALAISFVGKPIMYLLSRIRIKQYKLPGFVSAGITVILLWGVFLGFFFFFIPVIVAQLNAFSTMDASVIFSALDEPLLRIDGFLQQHTSVASDFSIKTAVIGEVENFFDANRITQFFSSLVGTIKSVGIAAGAITFITFFFLKENNMFFDFVILLFPARYEDSIVRALSAISKLLVRYFVGIFCDMLCILTLLSLGLTFVAGFPLKQAMLLGLIAGVLNIIPYVGPFVGYFLGVLFALTTSFYAGVDFGVLAIKTVCVFFVVQVTDTAFLQPFIYSNSIKAHPLEIFLVILIAGSLAGILGMLVAIPTYTILRIFAKEFFNNLRVVQKLTEKI